MTDIADRLQSASHAIEQPDGTLLRDAATHIERLTAERDRAIDDRAAHAKVISDTWNHAATALNVEGATRFTLLDLVQELVLQRDAARRQASALETFQLKLAASAQLSGAECLTDRVADLVHKESLLPALKQQVLAAETKAADLRLALDGLHDQLIKAQHRSFETTAAREREIQVFGEQAARLPWKDWAPPSPYPIELFRAVVDRVFADHGRAQAELDQIAAIMRGEGYGVGDGVAAAVASFRDEADQDSKSLMTALHKLAACAPSEAVTIALRQHGLTGPLDQCVLALCRDVAGIKAAHRNAREDARVATQRADQTATTLAETKRSLANVQHLHERLEVHSKRLKARADRMANKLAELALAGVNMKDQPPVDG